MNICMELARRALVVLISGLSLASIGDDANPLLRFAKQQGVDAYKVATSPRESMYGIKAIKVSVSVEGEFPELSSAGITDDQLVADIELRLRNAGVAVVAEDACHQATRRDCATLVVRVMALRRNGAGGFVVATEFSLSQMVITFGSPMIITPAMTWGSTRLSDVGLERTRELRDRIRDQADMFANGLLSENSKRTSLPGS